MNELENEIVDLKERLAEKEKQLEGTNAIIKQHELLWTNAPRIVRKTFTPEQIDRLFQVIENSNKLYLKNQWGIWTKARDRCILSFLYLCALRPKEACALKFTDIDFKNKIISISPTSNKEDAGRVIPMPPALLHFLKDYLSLPGWMWYNSPYIFPSFGSYNKSKHLSSSTWKGRFRNILKEAGIWEPCSTSKTHPPYSSYSLRHTKLSEIMAESGNIQLVSNIAGHKHLRSSQSYLSNYTSSKSYFELMRKALGTTGGEKEIES